MDYDAKRKLAINVDEYTFDLELLDSQSASASELPETAKQADAA
jgi:hypothetical protein